MQIITSYPEDYIYSYFLKLFKEVTNRGIEGATQYAVIQLVNYLVYNGFLPPQPLVMELLQKMAEYIRQTQINFHSFSNAFSVFRFFASFSEDRSDVQRVCLRELFAYLTNRTVKIRDQAFDQIIELLLQKGVDVKTIEKYCKMEWMLVNVQKAAAQRKEVADEMGLDWLGDFEV